MAGSKLYVREIKPSPTDLERIVRLLMESFGDTSLNKLLFPDPVLVNGFNEEELHWRIRTMTSATQDPNTHLVVALEEIAGTDGVTKEELIGSVIWVSPSDEVEPEQSPEEQAKEMQERMARLPPGVDKEAYKKIKAESAEMERFALGEVYGAKDYWVLQTLAVSVRHQRKGVGRMLTQWGIDEARKRGEHVCVIASPEGKRLYSSMGFEVLGEFQSLHELQTGMRYMCGKAE